MTYQDRARRSAASLFQARQAVESIDWEHTLKRFLADTLTQATASHWEARAKVLDDARPKPSDYNGRATRAELAALEARNAADAARCRLHAALLADADLLAPNVLTDAELLGLVEPQPWPMAA